MFEVQDDAVNITALEGFIGELARAVREGQEISHVVIAQMVRNAPQQQTGRLTWDRSAAVASGLARADDMRGDDDVLIDAAHRWITQTLQANAPRDRQERWRIRAFGPKGVSTVASAIVETSPGDDYADRPFADEDRQDIGSLDIMAAAPGFTTLVWGLNRVIAGAAQVVDQYRGAMAHQHRMHAEMIERLMADSRQRDERIDRLHETVLAIRLDHLEEREQRVETQNARIAELEQGERWITHIREAARDLGIGAGNVPAELQTALQSPETRQLLADPRVARLLSTPGALRGVLDQVGPLLDAMFGSPQPPGATP